MGVKRAWLIVVVGVAFLVPRAACVHGIAGHELGKASKRTTDRTAATAAMTEADSDLQTFTSGGHVIGFDTNQYFVSNGTYALRVDFDGARAVRPVATGVEPSTANNRDRAVALGRVTYAGLWEGIDASFDAGGGILRSTWTVAPGADPAAIRLKYNVPVEITGQEELALRFETGSLTESRPIAWQEIDGERRPVEVAFEQRGTSLVGLMVGNYRRDRALVIDPTLTWNTFLGIPRPGYEYGITVDASRNVYVTGTFTQGGPLGSEVFVARLDSSGARAWTVALGGIGYDDGGGIAVDASGNVYVTGASNSTWGSPVRAHGGSNDAFVARLNPETGGIVWNTFLGGSGGDYGSGIAISGASVFVTGGSGVSWGIPVEGHGGSVDTFVARLDSTSGGLIWNTFFGGSEVDLATSIATDGNEGTWVAGASFASWGSPSQSFTPCSIFCGLDGTPDAFVARLGSTGELIWNTFLGSGDYDSGDGIAVDASGNTYVTGRSFDDWGSPVQAYPGGRVAFVARLNQSGAMMWNTFLGGSGYDVANGIIVDGNKVFVTGESRGNWGSPVRTNAGGIDAFTVRLNQSGELVWNSFLGGPNDDVGYGIALGDGSNLFVTGVSSGTWGSPLWGFLPGAVVDVFVAQLPVEAPPTPTASATNTPTDTQTITVTATYTSTRTASATPTQTLPPTPSSTSTTTSTPTVTPTITSTATRTNSWTPTPTLTLTPSRTLSVTATRTPSWTPTYTPAPRPDQIITIRNGLRGVSDFPTGCGQSRSRDGVVLTLGQPTDDCPNTPSCSTQPTGIGSPFQGQISIDLSQRPMTGPVRVSTYVRFDFQGDLLVCSQDAVRVAAYSGNALVASWETTGAPNIERPDSAVELVSPGPIDRLVFCSRCLGAVVGDRELRQIEIVANFLPTPTPSPTITRTPTPSNTFTPTLTMTPTRTLSPTVTNTRTITRTFTITPTRTATPTFPPNVRQLPNGSTANNPRISDDGSVVVYDDGRNVFVIARDASFRRQLTDTSSGRCGRPWPNASGSRVAMECTANVTGNNADLNQEIVLLRGVEFVAITRSPDRDDAFNRAPRISADGQTIVFESNFDYLEQNVDGRSEVFLWRDGALRQVSRRNVDTILYGVSADGTRVLHGGRLDGNDISVTLNLDDNGTNRTVVGGDVPISYPQMLRNGLTLFASCEGRNPNCLSLPMAEVRTHFFTYAPTQNFRQITQSPIGFFGDGDSVAANRDGSRIAAMMAPPAPSNGDDIPTLFEAGRMARLLPGVPSDARAMTFDGDGRYLAFLSRQNVTGQNPSRQSQLFVAEIAFDSDPHTPTPTPTPTATGRPTPGQSCVGDCGLDGSVTVNEVIRGINVLLGTSSVGSCNAVDPDADGAVTVDEIQRAVIASLKGCSE